MTQSLWINTRQYDPSHPYVVKDDTGALVLCDECPCPPPPYCVKCSDWSWQPGYESTNYKQIWGIACNDDCSVAEPRLLGTYDVRWSIEEGDDWTGCVWWEWSAVDCRTWYGVSRRCTLERICDEKICGDPCLLRITSIIAQCSANGFPYQRATGWLYRPADMSQTPSSVTFWWITWTHNEVTGIYSAALHYLDCDCMEQEAATGNFQSAPSSPSDFGFKFLQSSLACDTGCSATVAALIAQAEQEGWVLHGEGLLVRRTSSQYSCYRFDTGVYKAQLIADTGSSFVCIDCNCNRVTYSSNYSLYTYLEYPGCACLDVRELLLSYPSMFGVSEVSYGDDTVYTRTPTSGTIWTYSCLQSSHGWDAFYCDYRNMYVIFDNTCIGMPYDNGFGSFVPDMVLLGFDTSGRWTNNGLKSDYIGSGTLVFDGKVPPFSTTAQNMQRWPHASSVGMEWQGLTIRWNAYNSNVNSSGAQRTETFWSESDAWAEIADSGYGTDDFLPQCSSSSTGFLPPRVSYGPDLSYTTVEGKVEYDSWSENYTAYFAGHQWANDGIVYNLNFVMTNKGFLVNGRSGYSDTLSVEGFTETAPYWANPSKTVADVEAFGVSEGVATMCDGPTESSDPVVCPAGTVVGVSFKTEISSVPMYDMSFHITDVSESMGGCMGDDWWDEAMNNQQGSN